MKAMHVTLRQIGNSHGFVVPKPVLAQLGLEGEVEMTIEGDSLVLRKPPKKSRSGWAEAAQQVAARGDDELVLGHFDNEGDADRVW